METAIDCTHLNCMQGAITDAAKPPKFYKPQPGEIDEAFSAERKFSPLAHYSSFHFIFHYPNMTPIYTLDNPL